MKMVIYYECKMELFSATSPYTQSFIDRTEYKSDLLIF